MRGPWPTRPGPASSHSAGMDEPTQANESRFWDQVADWLLDSRAYDELDLTEADIEAMLRDLGDADDF